MTTRRLSSQVPVLTSKEREIAQAARAREAESIRLLEKLVNINSGTFNFEGVAQVGQILRRELDALGFKTRWVDGASFGRAGHLIAERTGKGPRILLIGHLDTVFERDNPFQKFEWVSKTQARGPGITDMKGGDVIAIEALKALADQGVLEQMSLTLVFSGDEEAAGSPQALARQDLVEVSKGCDFVVGLEDGSGNPQLAITARRGNVSWTVTSTGNAAHSSLIGETPTGWGSAFEGARVLNDIRERLGDEKNLTISPGLVLAGDHVTLDTDLHGGSATGKPNIVSSQTQMRGDIRAISPEQLGYVVREMTDIVDHPLSGTRSELTLSNAYPPLATTETSREMLTLYSNVSEDLGYGPVHDTDPRQAGAADISFTAGWVPGALDAIGLPGKGGHTSEETADMSMLTPKTQTAAIFWYRLSQTPSSK